MATPPKPSVRVAPSQSPSVVLGRAYPPVAKRPSMPSYGMSIPIPASSSSGREQPVVDPRHLLDEFLREFPTDLSPRSKVLMRSDAIWAKIAPARVVDYWLEQGVETATDLAFLYTNADEFRNEFAGCQGEWLEGTDFHLCIQALSRARQSFVANNSILVPLIARADAMPPAELVPVLPEAKRPRIHALSEDKVGAIQAITVVNGPIQVPNAVTSRADMKKAQDLDQIYAIIQSSGEMNTRWTEDLPGMEAEAQDRFLRPLMRMDQKRVRALLNVFRRWIVFFTHFKQNAAFAVSDSLQWKPSPALLGKFLSKIANGGPTAACAVFHALLVWQDKLGFELGLNDPGLADYRFFTPGHVQTQAEEFQPWEFWRLLHLCHVLTGPMQMFASMVLTLLGICIRFAHAQRSVFVSIDALHVKGCCSMGKRRVQGSRPPFHFYVPRLYLPMGPSALDDPVARFYAFWMDYRVQVPTCNYFIPDVRLVHGIMVPSSTWTGKPMSYAKFTSLLQGLLVNIGHTPSEALARSTYCTRRFLPTAGDVLHLPSEDRAALGNWQEQAKGNVKQQPFQQTMQDRYAGNKDEGAGAIKRFVMAKVLYVLRTRIGPPMTASWIGAEASDFQPNWSQFRVWSDSTVFPDDINMFMSPEITQLAKSEHKALMPCLLPESDEQVIEDSSSSSSSSASEECLLSPSPSDSEQLVDPEDVQGTLDWFVQRKLGPGHVVQRYDDEARLVPWCRNKAWPQDPDAKGTGADCLKTMAPLCSKCLSRMPALLAKALRE